MLIDFNAIPENVIPNMRGGEKETRMRMHTDALCKVVQGRLIPGASIGYHVHEGETELFYFMEGCGRVQDDDQFVDVTAGDCMATFSGHGHSVENTGDTNLVLLAAIIKD